MTLLRTLFNRRWWWTTLLVVVGMLVLVRLGLWQLDRLAQRRAANVVLQQQLDVPPVSLNEGLDDLALATMTDRQVVVTGVFDFEHQFLLKLQYYNNTPGGHLLAPLRLPGREEAILVDRGWIPETALDPAAWGQFDEPGEVTVTGRLRPTETLSRNAGATPDPAAVPGEVYRVDIAAVQRQVPYPLLPVYLLQAPAGANDTPPLRAAPEFDLSEGPHLSYAIQWFSFALMLGVGYVYYVWRHTRPGGR
ncbi:MAG: SURF1 family protein [Ardenticatenaceae bacterium]|nr:SURF1 family protein [Anaerolineales bacterium]MCB8918884.1 SURF1 family protein [Ardenticatenaceae bacterium]